MGVRVADEVAELRKGMSRIDGWVVLGVWGMHACGAARGTRQKACTLVQVTH